MEGANGSAGRGEIAVSDNVVELTGSARRDPRVSVVIPTYNHAASLRRLLTALEKTQRPLGGMEIIVVDDGSTDDTRAVAAKAGVRYVWQRNAGTAAARDHGWRSAAGDVIVFLDDDTIPDRDAVALLDEALKDCDGVGAHFVALGSSSLIADYTHADGLIDHRVVRGEVRWLITGAAAFRRSALQRVEGFDLGFLAAGEDVDLSIRMLHAGCVLAVEPRAVVRHDHRARFGQLLETCYRYGTFSRALAARHRSYRGERTASARRRLSPADWVRLYRAFRVEASRRRSLAFLGLHQLVVLPYAMGFVRSLFSAEPLAAPSWRRLPGVIRTAGERTELEESEGAAALAGVRWTAREASTEPEASAV